MSDKVVSLLLVTILAVTIGAAVLAPRGMTETISSEAHARKSSIQAVVAEMWLVYHGRDKSEVKTLGLDTWHRE